jgi:hypothetical protein
MEIPVRTTEAKDAADRCKEPIPYEAWVAEATRLFGEEPTGHRPASTRRRRTRMALCRCVRQAANCSGSSPVNTSWWRNK